MTRYKGLTQYSDKGVRKLDANLSLLLWRKYIHHAIDGLRSRTSVQCTKYQVTCFGGGYG